MRTNNYATILGALGKLFDLAEARSFSVREIEHGLTLEFVDGRDERHTVELSLADVAALIAWSQRSAVATTSHADHTEANTLRTFLDRHSREMVGAV